MSNFQNVRYITVGTSLNAGEKQIQLDNAKCVVAALLEGYKITSAISDGSSVHYILCLKANIWQRINMAIYGCHTVKID